MTGWKGATGNGRIVVGVTVLTGTTFARRDAHGWIGSDEDECSASASTLTVVSKILFRTFLFSSFFARRMKYFCACDATCVGVREGTNSLDMVAHRPFPSFFTPLTKLACSSLVHGTAFVLDLTMF